MGSRALRRGPITESSRRPNPSGISRSGVRPSWRTGTPSAV